MDGFPSGQREQTVNLPSQTSMVRIHPHPPNFAGMAELADAHGSGPCEGDFMQVQVLFPAPNSVVLEHLICRKTTLFVYVHFRWLSRNFAEEKALMMLTGGPIASLIWPAALLVIHKFVYASEIITFMFCCSFPQFVLTTIPMRYPACLFDISVSDGMQILRILKKASKIIRSKEKLRKGILPFGAFTLENYLIF